MSLPVHNVRRATINDLVALRAIWSEERFAVGELEARFTEFQIVEDQEGRIMGALALQIHGNQGHIHSEAIATPEHTDALRELLWDRLRKVAGNHGLVRVWTSAAHTHFADSDFRSPTEAEHGKRPVKFGEISAGWMVLQLKEESEKAVSLEQELAIFREAQKAEAEIFQAHAKKMRILIAGAAFVFLVAVWLGGYFFWYHKIRKPDTESQVEQIPTGMPAPAPQQAPTNNVPPDPATLKPAPLPNAPTNQPASENKSAN